MPISDFIDSLPDNDPMLKIGSPESSLSDRLAGQLQDERLAETRFQLAEAHGEIRTLLKRIESLEARNKEYRCLADKYESKIRDLGGLLDESHMRTERLLVDFVEILKRPLRRTEISHDDDDI